MKTKKRSVFRILIPILAAVALLAAGACAWLYFSGVGADFYISRGDSALAAGRFGSAIRYYSIAKQMTNAPAVTVSLANAYEGAGNYTKAEYMLVSSIQDNPEQTELYVALSRVYVAQGKFLDADQMLSRAANDSVREQLQQRRPAAPVITPESGYYASYITICLESKNKVYLRTDGEYPSREDDLYTGPIELPGGETTVCALAVDENGLVSPAVYAGFTIAGVIEPVTLEDPALDKQVRAALGKEPDETLMTSDLWTLESLELSSLGSVSQLSLFAGLKELTISSASDSDFSSIGALTQLEKLNLSGCVLSEASVKAIGALSELTELRLSSCALKSIAPFSALSRLEVLALSDNVITSAAPLEGMTALRELDLKNNPIGSVSELSACVDLEKLNLSGCKLDSLEALAGMVKLKTLDASANEISSLAPLSDCLELTQLNVSDNAVSDISVLTKLPKLEEIDASHNQITSLPTFRQDAPLAVVDLNYNGISSVKGLSGLYYLNYVHLDYNHVSDLSPLAECSNLVQVDAWDNPVSGESVQKLLEHSIIVNYKPDT